MADNSSTDETHSEVATGSHQCVLCCDTITIFAIGACDHPVCFRCSARMRVLADQRYCAVCRTNLDQVVFTKNLCLFADVTLKGMPGSRKHGIRFKSKDCSAQFTTLLESVCPICENRPSFRTFNDLRTHVRKEHSRQYCDICTNHLHIFPSEFTVYSRQDLIKHRKGGEAKDMPLKGHPLCEFCDERYFDDDELLLHLRKNHFWCHFCEKDGKQEYYCNYDELRDHFRSGHFLCEDDKCKYEQFTSVFRSKIDLQAHKLATHSNKLSKAATKQIRQLDIDIDYGSRRKGKRGAPTSSDSSASGAAPASDSVAYEKPDTARNNSAAVENTLLGAAAASNSGSSVNVVPNPRNAQATTAPNGVVPQGNSNSPIPKRSSTAPAGQSRGPPSFASTTASGSPQSVPRGNTQSHDRWSNIGQPGRTLSDSNFPSLSSAQPATTKPSKAPPGFAHAVKRSEPPGLKVVGAKPKVLENNRKQLDVLVKSIPDTVPNTKNSNGEVKSRPPGFPVENKGDQISFQARNQRLIDTMNSFMSHDDFSSFRVFSGQYRKGEMTGKDYYNEIKRLLGDNLKLVFSELVDLLPDANKQSELLSIYNDDQIIKRTSGQPKNDKKWKERKKKSTAAEDTGFDCDFPSLQSSQQKKRISNSVPSVPASNVWAKK